MARAEAETTENRKSVRIAVNVMRARLTVIGFNIAIVSFQISQLNKMSGGIDVPGFDHQLHIKDDIALFVGLSLSIISFIAFIMSCAHDEVGVCDHWSFIVGDILMYLALASTVTGFFAPLAETLSVIIANMPEQAERFVLFRNVILLAGAAAWFLAIYGGPIVTFIRSPFPRKINVKLGIAYVMLLLTLGWVNTQAFMLDLSTVDQKATVSIEFLKELVQPVKW